MTILEKSCYSSSSLFIPPPSQETFGTCDKQVIIIKPDLITTPVTKELEVITPTDKAIANSLEGSNISGPLFIIKQSQKPNQNTKEKDVDMVDVEKKD